MKIKKGDTVVVVRGKDKGKKGKVERVLTKNAKILVHEINLFKRHVKGNMQNRQSEIITIVKPLNVASVAIICPSCHLQTRVGYVVLKGIKKRICRKCGKVI
jgi:large subunit ribosomal protein L24